jgi:hypothetical protein
MRLWSKYIHTVSKVFPADITCLFVGRKNLQKLQLQNTCTRTDTSDTCINATAEVGNADCNLPPFTEQISKI